jgi:integrase
VTFEAVAEAYMALHSGSWKNSKHVAQWPSTLKTYVYPTLGRLPVRSVDRDLVVKVLEPIWMTKPETGRRLRMRIQRVMDHAIALGEYQGENPASPGPLKTLLATQTSGDRHFKALHYKKAPAFMSRLRERDGVGSAALEYLVLTATRTSEVLLAEWREIDRQTRTWEVPPHHRKGRKNREKPLFVPLSGRAWEILTEAEKRTGGAGLIFPNPVNGKRLSENALLQVVAGLGVKAEATPRGFRSTFQGWREDETSYPPELGEHAIGHAVPGVAGDYRRTTALERRRPMMKDWAQFLATPWEEPIGHNVVKFRGGAA